MQKHIIVKCTAINKIKNSKMLPKKAVDEFKVLYEKNYGLKLSDEEASRRANNLVALFEVVYEDYDLYKVNGKWYKKPKQK